MTRVLNVQVSKQSCFLNIADIELLFAAQNILLGEPRHSLCSQVYGSEFVAGLGAKYHFLFEIFGSIDPNHTSGLFEHLLWHPWSDFCLAGFRDYLVGLEPAVFFTRFFGVDEKVFSDLSDAALEKLYGETSLFTSFLGCQSFFRQRERYISDYFALCEELRTDAFMSAVSGASADVERELEKARAALAVMSPLEYSEQIMGKTFYNRGPYKMFGFCPSLFVPYRAVRFFGEDQILFYSIRPTAVGDEDVLKQLKVIADGTRFKIISLLGDKGPLRGMDVAEAMGVAPSTISHHMEQLKGVGLLHEEQVKNSKYYSINKNNVRELLRRLTETLGKLD